ncbi:MAG: flavohemoglobin expression-modulating QEGLA motif protein [bacterium]
MKSAHAPLSAAWIREVAGRLAEGRPVRRNLPHGGRLHIDRPLPFLCVYRDPPGRTLGGTERLITGEAAYLATSAAPELQPGIARLVETVVEVQAREFGAFLLVELWAGPPRGKAAVEQEELTPVFKLRAREGRELSPTLHALEHALKELSRPRREAKVELRFDEPEHPSYARPLLPAKSPLRKRCYVLGLELRPIYLHPKTREVFPLVRRALQRLLGRAFKQAFFEFVKTRTTHRPPHFLALGRRAMVKAVWEVDRQLAEISNAYDFLLQATPVNSERAWHAFKRSHFGEEPVFHYRPIPVDPPLLKRRLFAVPIERVEDPTLAQIFREKQEEMDRELTMLVDRGTRRFLYGSLQLFGGVGPQLLAMAQRLLKIFPPRSREAQPGWDVDAAGFAERAREEIAYYRSRYPKFAARVEVRDDIASGLMVSRGHLLVGMHSKIPVSRVEALLNHEVGTHLVTYYNGRAQPFRQLYSGLAGYEELQEGLAVLAEYLVGGLSRPRIRLLAGRVLATKAMVEGADFLEVFRMLTQDYGFERKGAYTITLRIFRGGGLTKDAVYLRGVVAIFRYLREGGDLSTLFVGKIAADHVPVVQELQWRGVLKKPPLLPRYMERPESLDMLEQLRRGVDVLDLLKRRGL